MSPADLSDLLRSPYVDDELAGGLRAVVVPVRDAMGRVTTGGVTATGPGSLPLIVIGIGTPDDILEPLSLFDLVLAEDDPDLAAITATIGTNPVASTSLAVLLRGSAQLPVEHGLAAESAIYSMLQSGAEFHRWRTADDHPTAAPDDRPAVAATRVDDELRIVLDRPHRHNAFSRSMRDALSEMLALALSDTTVGSVHLSGNGPSFCSGGDLGEFGSFTDPADAHTTRLTRSPARLMHRLAARTVVQIHGACMGAGIELPAFAQHVRAHPDALIALPEVGLGLIPGAGGTVSVSRRVGRQRCLQLALTGRPISAGTALEWGLIDEISEA